MPETDKETKNRVPERGQKGGLASCPPPTRIITRFWGPPDGDPGGDQARGLRQKAREWHPDRNKTSKTENGSKEDQRGQRKSWGSDVRAAMISTGNRLAGPGHLLRAHNPFSASPTDADPRIDEEVYGEGSTSSKCFSGPGSSHRIDGKMGTAPEPERALRGGHRSGGGPRCWN